MRKIMLGLSEAIEECLKNRTKGKEAIYKSFYGYLMGITLRYINDRSDAEELVNDTFIKIFRNLHQFSFPQEPTETRKAFKGWIAKISSRTAIDFLRAKKIQFSQDEIPEEQQPFTQVNAISQLNAQDIIKLLDRLPETHRLIFNLYEVEGFSHEEISRMLSISESSSRVYLTRAKAKLRELYSKTIVNSYAAS